MAFDDADVGQIGFESTWRAKRRMRDSEVQSDPLHPTDAETQFEETYEEAEVRA